MIVMIVTWRTHACVPGRHSCRRMAGVHEPRVHKSVNAARRSACATLLWSRLAMIPELRLSRTTRPVWRKL
jgi:hypothetical protein